MSSMAACIDDWSGGGRAKAQEALQAEQGTAADAKQLLYEFIGAVCGGKLTATL